MSSTLRRALISVSDKKGLIPFAEELAALSFEIVSTGGTARLLREAGIEVTSVADITGFPEIMDGRVKTLHPKIHGGLLARAGVDEAVAAEHGIGLIDLVVINLYPFAATVARPDCTYDDAIENIDIGGPAMIRAAAKNHARVTIVVDSADYEDVLGAIREESESFELRQKLAAKAFAHTASYDSMIADYLGKQTGEHERFPQRLLVSHERRSRLRYGENPHQGAASYLIADADGPSVISGKQLHGKDLSFNNLVDADTALACALSFKEPTCVIVKHANPCGVGQAESAVEAYGKAYAADPTSAFGGVIALNRNLDAATAEAILNNQFVEVIVAPEVTADAMVRLESKPDIRVLACGEGKADTRSVSLSSVQGGLLLQDTDTGSDFDSVCSIVTREQPDQQQLADLRFAWQVVRFVKSNAIVFVANGQTIGVGAGQMSRIMSTRIAAMQAQEFGFPTASAAMASDAFFPFRDNVDLAAELGIRAIVQPGGSKKDDEVVKAADEHGIVMAFTGHRHFRH